jgi:response regulator RpfG family c-di-GMP phosphodiesterase
VHVLIADQRMPDMAGSEVLRLVRERHPTVRRMLVTAYADLQAIVDALNFGGACFYIQKPWEEETVRSAVAAAFEEFRAEEERTAYTARLVESNRQLEFALRQRLLS